MQHMESFARAMADRQHEMACRDRLAVLQDQGADFAASGLTCGDIHAGDFRLEPVLTAKRFNFSTDSLDDGDQSKCANVRLAVPHDFLGTARRDKLAEHLAAEVTRFLDPAVKLAIRECSGTAFAELRVAFRDQDPAPP